MADKEKRSEAERMERKNRSETILRRKKIPICDSLPPVDAKADVTLRTPQEVARRATVIAVIAAKSESGAWDLVPAQRILEDRGLWNDVTPKERAYLAKRKEPPEQLRGEFSWKYEGAWVLLWALGHIDDDDLGEPTNICDVPRLSAIVAQTPPEQFINGAKLRPIERILDEMDLIYRYHWAAVDARINGRPPPGDMEPGVVYERHYAFYWLTRFMDQEWDDVQTHT
jgi:hypothetical protein